MARPAPWFCSAGTLRRVAFAAFVAVAAGTAHAQERPASPQSLDLDPAEVRAAPMPRPQGGQTRIGGRSPGPCVQVDIAGHRAGTLDCASQTLQSAAQRAQSQARATIDPSVSGAGSPDVRVGVSSLAGSRLRMGNALGRSVDPQRPVRLAPAPRGGRP
ncbi:hypothetical protein TPR58_01625 [Sphingomonas sp. HF-S3]|uniref:UrcA family protein n=1 Tax=Sphingomonas rustica TaxID=3103142 RepID=A0ABV0B2M5_9SPHN